MGVCLCCRPRTISIPMSADVVVGFFKQFVFGKLYIYKKHADISVLTVPLPLGANEMSTAARTCRRASWGRGKQKSACVCVCVCVCVRVGVPT